MDGIFAGRSIDNSGPSLVNLRRHENSCFSIFSNTLLLEQDDRTDVQGKGSIFRLKEVHARNFFKVYSSRPPNNFLHGLLWVYSSGGRKLLGQISRKLKVLAYTLLTCI